MHSRSPVRPIELGGDDVGLAEPTGHAGRIRRFFKILGPGLITGASDDDPSGIGTYSVAGAAYGFSTLWLALATFPMMFVVQSICARVGMVSGRGMAAVVKRFYPRWLVYPIALLLFAANTINVGADLGAMAASINLFTGWPIRLVIVPVGAAVVALMVFAHYRLIVGVFKWLTISLFAYVITGLLVHGNWHDVVRHTFVPELQLDGGFIATVVAILGTTISPYLFFWQSSQEVEEEVEMGRTSVSERQGATDREVGERNLDVAVGMGVSNIVMYFIILTTGATLFVHGQHNISDASTAAQALAPLAGPAAKVLFGVALLFTGLLAVPVLAGSAAYALSDAFGWKMGLNRPIQQVPAFYGVMVIAVVVGLVLNFTSIDPIQALVLTAIINGVVAPILLVVIMLVANNERIMGARKNGIASNVIGWLTTGALGVAAVALFLTLGK
ncbi:MAG TPA: divalent metal cation transporter [Chloroflexota bacterium]|nr:divalent metal cation transporter [Chloroflexota bacterium]